MVEKLASIGVNISWPPAAGALPAPREPASGADAASQSQQSPRQVG